MQTARPNPQSVPRWLAVVLGLVAVAGGLMLPLALPKPADPAATVQSSTTEDAPSPVADVSGIDLGGSLLRLYIAAFVILVLGVGGIVYHRRRLAAYAPANEVGQLEVLGVVRIDVRSQVVLVRVRNQKLLAGIDGTGLKLLVPVNAQSLPAALTATQPPARAA